MSRFLAPALLVALAALLPACGGATLADQVADLQASSDSNAHEEVVAGAPALLEAASAAGDSAQAWKVEKLRVTSLAHLGKGKEALEHLARLAGEHKGKVTASLYSEVGGYVIESRNFEEAIAVLDAGKKAFPEMAANFDPAIEDIKQKATESGDTGALDALKSLGYL